MGTKRAGRSPDRDGAPREGIAPARWAAARILLGVSEDGAHSDELLHAAGPGAALEGQSEPDRRLATALVMGVLRWQMALDRRLRGLLARPDVAVPEPVMVALRLGAFQLLHMDRIPAHAALGESVALARAAGYERSTGMVNAVLRRVLAERDSPEKQVLFETPAALARRLAHPEWMVERWARVYGYAATRAICEADQKEPADAGWFVAEPGLPAMDAGSRLVAEMTAAALRRQPEGARVWDACAAPGGKTAVLATRLHGAEVLATDVSGRRLRQMEQRLGALAASAGGGGGVRCVVADAEALPLEEGDFDLVLCDVPCSGTGTLGRNPEIRLRLEEESLRRQAERQTRLLRAAMKRVLPGGRLVYSTCSLEPEECGEVVDAVLGSATQGWRQLEIAGLLDDAVRSVLPEGAVQGGALRTLPGREPVDGFYAVVLERVTG